LRTAVTVLHTQNTFKHNLSLNISSKEGTEYSDGYILAYLWRIKKYFVDNYIWFYKA